MVKQLTITKTISQKWKEREEKPKMRVVNLTMQRGIYNKAQEIMKNYGYKTFSDFMRDALLSVPAEVKEIFETGYRRANLRLSDKNLQNYLRITNKSAFFSFVLLLYVLDLEKLSLL